jgi:prepilin-type N-terminal cleavage/methylation domain-containing protein
MKKRQIHQGFSLVEVAVAVAVASFCLLILVALLPTGITSNKVSVDQTVATGLMSGVVADLRSAPMPTSATVTGSLLSPRYQIPLPRVGDPATTAPGYTLFLKEDGSLSGTLNANSDPTQSPGYRVLLNFYPPAAGNLAATRVRIVVTWPALSDSKATVAPSNFSGSVETVFELNRNWQDH